MELPPCHITSRVVPQHPEFITIAGTAAEVQGVCRTFCCNSAGRAAGKRQARHEGEGSFEWSMPSVLVVWTSCPMKGVFSSSNFGQLPGHSLSWTFFWQPASLAAAPQSADERQCPVWLTCALAFGALCRLGVYCWETEMCSPGAPPHPGRCPAPRGAGGPAGGGARGPAGRPGGGPRGGLGPVGPAGGAAAAAPGRGPPCPSPGPAPRQRWGRAPSTGGREGHCRASWGQGLGCRGRWRHSRPSWVQPPPRASFDGATAHRSQPLPR